MAFDVLIIGGGVAGISCALVLGSAKNKPFMQEVRIGVITHQKASSLQQALFNNAYGIPAGTLGSDLLHSSITHLSETYPHIQQIQAEKVLAVQGSAPEFTVVTNKSSYKAKNVVVAVGYANTFHIEGLMQYVQPHAKTPAAKARIQLANVDHLIAPGLYVAGNLAGWRSQLPIASGSGASVATDLLTVFNAGSHAQSHDKI